MYYTGRNRTISQYFTEITGHENLTREKEVELFRRIESGDGTAKDEIFGSLARFAVKIAKEYTGEPELLSDLIQEANAGILESFDGYDWRLGYRFSSYAVRLMRSRIRDFLNRNQTVYVGGNNNVQKTAKRLRREYAARTGHEISRETLDEMLVERGIVVKDKRCLDDVNMISIDRESYVGAEMKYVGEFAMTTASENGILKKIDTDDTGLKARRMLSCLDEKERKIVEMKFGFGDPAGTEMNFSEIARACPGPDGKILSPERIRQIYGRAVKKMKKMEGYGR